MGFRSRKAPRDGVATPLAAVLDGCYQNCFGFGCRESGELRKGLTVSNCHHATIAKQPLKDYCHVVPLDTLPSTQFPPHANQPTSR